MKSDAVIYIYIITVSCASRVGCSKNIFAVFAKKERTNFFLFFDFFDQQTDQTLEGQTKQIDSLHSFTQTREEAFRLKHHFIIESEHFPRAHVLLSSERSAS